MFVNTAFPEDVIMKIKLINERKTDSTKRLDIDENDFEHQPPGMKHIFLSRLRVWVLIKV